MSVIRLASEPPDAFLLAITTFSTNGVRAEVPRRQPVWPGPSMSTSRWTVLTGWASVPGLVLLPTVEATRVHVLGPACPDDETARCSRAAMRSSTTAAGKNLLLAQDTNPPARRRPHYTESTRPPLSQVTVNPGVWVKQKGPHGPCSGTLGEGRGGAHREAHRETHREAAGDDAGEGRGIRPAATRARVISACVAAVAAALVALLRCLRRRARSRFPAASRTRPRSAGSRPRSRSTSRRTGASSSPRRAGSSRSSPTLDDTDADGLRRPSHARSTTSRTGASRASRSIPISRPIPTSTSTTCTTPRSAEPRRSGARPGRPMTTVPRRPPGPGDMSQGCVVSGRVSRLRANGDVADGPGAGAGRGLVPPVLVARRRRARVRRGRQPLCDRRRRRVVPLLGLRAGRRPRQQLASDQPLRRSARGRRRRADAADGRGRPAAKPGPPDARRSDRPERLADPDRPQHRRGRARQPGVREHRSERPPHARLRAAQPVPNGDPPGDQRRLHR